MVEQKVIDWLLEEENPSVRYRTQTELLDLDPKKTEVAQTRKSIESSKSVRRILTKMHPDGYWLQKNPRTKKMIGEGVEYGSFATTHFCLAYLSELGLTRKHPAVEKAATRYLNLVKPDGDWWGHMSCLYGYNIRTFIRLGFRNDPLLKKPISLMLDTKRKDGGYLCDMHSEKYKTKEVKSCVRGSVKALLAFSEMPEYWDHPRCKQLISYFLKREGIYNSAKNQLVNKDMHIFSFPLTWGTNSWEILLALSKMGYGNDKKLENAWKLIQSKSTANGKFKLDSTPSQSPFKVGAKGQENKWITFYVMLAKKYRSATQSMKKEPSEPRLL